MTALRRSQNQSKNRDYASYAILQNGFISSQKVQVLTIFDAIILGTVEGLTEFLPVSSTGHLIMTSKLLGLEQTDAHKAFEVAIQLGSILAVLTIYLQKILRDRSLALKLAIAFIPTGAIGFLFYKHIKALFVPSTVAYMLILGGIGFLILEKFYRPKERHITTTDEITIKQALIIGFAQSLAMIPGTSRSAATIIGGMLVGLNRKLAVEFSFLLALPTMLVATAYDIYKNHATFAVDDWNALVVGFGVAFVVALFAVKTFLKLVSRFNFTPFGLYRIAIGVLFLWFFV
jgi:undecaprenyl-diphosphatase